MISKVGSARQQQHFFLSLRQIIRSDGGGGGHLARRCVGMCHQKENPRESENNDLKSTSCYTLTSFRSGAWHRLTTKRSSLFRNSKQIFLFQRFSCCLTIVAILVIRPSLSLLFTSFAVCLRHSALLMPRLGFPS